MSLTCLVKPAVDPGDLFNPLAPLGMLQVENVVEGPVEVIGQVGYLLLQAIRGVA